MTTGPSSSQRYFCSLALAISVLLPGAVLLGWVLGQHQPCTGSTLLKLPQLAWLAREQPAYKPSTWEQEWTTAAAKEMVERDGSVCKWMAAHGKQAQAWLAGVAAWRRGSGGASRNDSDGPDLHGPPADIFSSFHLPGSGITAHIEPLVGHLR